MRTFYNFRAIAAVVMLLSLLQVFFLTPAPALAVDATVRVAGKPAFDVLASAGGYSATARAEVMQKNIDNALVATASRGPAAVNIVYVKGQPVLTVGGYYVGTVDNASAKAAGTTPALLASRWASSLKSILSDSASVEAYVAHLTGGERTVAQSLPPVVDTTVEVAGVPMQRGRIVYLPAGLTLPIMLDNGISTRASRPGDVVQAHLSQDVVLGNGDVLSAGTVVQGHVTAVAPGRAFFGGPGTVAINFDTMRLNSGTTIPISASIVGGISEVQHATMLGGLRESTFGRVVTRGAVGAGLGAALGTAIGAIAGGGRGVGRGAWSGAAIGGGLGALSGLILRPDAQIQFPAGQQLTLQLNAPAQIAVLDAGYL